MRTVHHSTHIQQPLATPAASRPQDVPFFQEQLLRAISLSLSAVGYDGVRPTALEAFRAEVEQYVMRFLALVTSSMRSNRRLQPVPQDFIAALAGLGLNPSDLLPHLELPLAPDLTQPALPPPPPNDPSPPRLDIVLGPELTGLVTRRKYVPSHLPELPSRHTWRRTPVFPQREQDARKIRELATEEGIKAEQAMRKLMATGAHAKAIPQHQRSRKDQKVWEEAMASILQMDEEQRQRDEALAAQEWEFEGLESGANGSMIKEGKDANYTMLVNYEEKFWRKTQYRRR